MRSFFLVLIVLGFSLPAVAQTSSITGSVYDVDTKAPLIGAHVTIPGTNIGTATDLDGNYSIKGIPVGRCSLKFSYIGYEPVVRTDIIVKPSRGAVVDAGLKISAFRSGEVEVTPDYFSTSEDRVLSAVTFSYEEIRRAPGAAGDVSRIMMSLPSVGEVNDQSNGLIVRGGSPVENAFFVDNIGIPNINHFPTQGASSGPIGLLNVDLIRDVTFYSGGFPAGYGDRLSSVMDISFREGNRKKLAGELNLDFAGFGGVAEGPLFGGKGSWLVSVRRSYLDLLIKTIDIGTSVVPRYGDYQWKAVYDAGSDDRLELLGIWGDDHNNPDAETAAANDMIYYGNQDHYQSTNGINWRHLWGKSGYSNTSVAFTSEDFSDDSYETGTGLPIQRNRSLEEALTLRNINHFRLSDADVAELGFEVSHNISDYNIDYSNYTDALGNPVAGSTVDARIRAEKAGAFATLLTEISRVLSLSVGVRGDYFSYNGNFDISPRGSVTARLDANTSVTASAGIYYQTLPFLLLAQNEDNKTLKDLSAAHYIIGFERLVGESAKLSLDIYRKDYADFPVDPQQPSLFLIDELYYRYGFFFDHGNLTGGGKARSQGIEMILQKKMAKDFYGLLCASYSSSRYMGSDGRWVDRVYDNRFIFSVEGGYRPDEEWEFSMRWIYAGGVPYTPFDQAASHAIDRGVLDGMRVNADRLPPYNSLNVRFDKRFNFSASDIVLYISVWNAYNRRNVAQYFWNEVRNEQGTIYQWGILPVFGIKYEF